MLVNLCLVAMAYLVGITVAEESNFQRGLTSVGLMIVLFVITFTVNHGEFG